MRHSFASIGSDMLRLQAWSQKPQLVPLVQTFNSAVCSRLRSFHRSLAEIEQRFTEPKSPVIVSILHLHQEIETLGRPFGVLSALATSIPDHGGNFICLEMLYDQLCSLQAVGDDECYKMLGQIFFECLKIYLRPVALWMQEGTILDNDESFFIAVADKGSSPSSLWHERYTLRITADGALHAPKFMRPAAKKVLNAGKSIVFLQHLEKDRAETTLTAAPELTYDAICGRETMVTLIPFSELFSDAFSDWIGSKYGPASSILNAKLFDSCGLLRHLGSLEYIYFSRDGALFQTFADELFKRMDNPKGEWNDKFLLSELARRTFGTLQNVKSGSLSVRTTQLKQTPRSVKVLSGILVDVNLPWAIQNIIQRSSMTTYQGIFCLLLQINRAKNLLRSDNSSFRHSCVIANRLSIAIRQQLIWFANIMYSYVTETVVQTSVEDLRKSLATAEDIDVMCEQHEKFITRLQLSCLLAKNLTPIHDSIISMLDLTVLYNDTQTSRAQKDSSGDAASKTTSQWSYSLNRGRTMHRAKQGGDGIRIDRSAISDSDISDEEDELETDSAKAFEQEQPYEERLQMIHDQFSQLLHFTVAGLRGIGRAGGELAWEMLAERFEWGLHKPSRDFSYG
jgi:gamma-tubulin complex component 5